MPSPIKDYALIGNCLTSALVGRDGSIDWACMPYFDSEACFAALLGGPEHGRWQIAPVGKVKRVDRRYREGTLVLETDFKTNEGSVRLIDFMPPRSEAPHLVRIVEGLEGDVRMHMEMIIRFDYGSIIPWVQDTDCGIRAIAGPDKVRLLTPERLHEVDLEGKGRTTIADFDIRAGQRLPFVLTWSSSHQLIPTMVDSRVALRETEGWWRAWSARCTYKGPWEKQVLRSLITLKALTYAPTGGIVAAPTTSLPEQLGGPRNWDYRYCWLRDATFTLLAMFEAGYTDEARAWREWLLRAVAGDPSQLQIMYGLRGERRLIEFELNLPGYAGSKPVRVGNQASRQFQLDVYGELIDALYRGRELGLESSSEDIQLVHRMMNHLESCWEQPDEGIWEVRGGRKHFTHSKVMAWVAFDRVVKAIENKDKNKDNWRLNDSAENSRELVKWRQTRDTIREEVCSKAFDPKLGAFTQYYGSQSLDASLLMLPLVGFLPATDEKMEGTIKAIERKLKTKEGFVARYDTGNGVDGLPPGEGMFLICSFWLASNLYLLGKERSDDAQTQEAIKLFERLLDACNDVGLLAEEYDPETKQHLGNFPQAFSHIGLITTACMLAPGKSLAEQRARS